MKVSDSGCSKRKIDTIFDSFSHNIDNKRKFGGLGLACLKNISGYARRNNKNGKCGG
jgi:hypothetical protein